MAMQCAGCKAKTDKLRHEFQRLKKDEERLYVVIQGFVSVNYLVLDDHKQDDIENYVLRQCRECLQKGVRIRHKKGCKAEVEDKKLTHLYQVTKDKIDLIEREVGEEVDMLIHLWAN